MTRPSDPSDLPATADVVIVGGGAVGVSAAYHLAAAGAGRVLLLEREVALGTGSTGRCAGGFRHQFSSRINVELSLASIPLITGFSETHGLPLDVVQDGYLFLVRDEADWARFGAAAAMQRELGVDARLLDPAGAAELAPGVDLDGVIGATYCPDDGIADPSGLTQGYATAARRAGATIRTGVRVDRVEVSAGAVTGLATDAGRVSTPVVVNAAGAWAGILAATAGVTVPIEPIARPVLVTGPFPGRPDRRTLVIDAATSFYFHREGEGVLMGMGDPDEQPTFETRIDERFVAEALLPTALRILPGPRGRRDRPQLGRALRDDPGSPRDHRPGAGSRGARAGERLQRARLPARADRGQAPRRAHRGRRRPIGGYRVPRPRSVHRPSARRRGPRRLIRRTTATPRAPGGSPAADHGVRVQADHGGSPGARARRLAPGPLRYDPDDRASELTIVRGG